MTTVQVTSVTQSSNELLGSKEKKLCYLIITNGDMKETINIGEKTMERITKLLAAKPKK